MCTWAEGQHSFRDPYISSRAPSTFSFHSHPQRGDPPLYGTSLFPLVRQCFIHLLETCDFDHDMKTIKKAQARALALGSHPVISGIS